MINEDHKEGISALFEAKFKESGFDSQAKFAKTLDLTTTDATNLLNRKWKDNAKLIAANKWMRIARKLNYVFDKIEEWNTAPTYTTKKISTQLELCQAYGRTGIYCDMAGIGKTHTARMYADTHANAFYLSCGKARTRARFIRKLANCIGLSSSGNLDDLVEDVADHLKTLEKPLLIFDEAGDLRDECYLEIKNLYNDLEFQCGIYMLGARGLRRKIDAGVRLRKNGFEEMFSRFGNRYTTSIDEKKEGKDRVTILREQADVVCKANGITDADEKGAIVDCEDDLRRVRREILKLRLRDAQEEE